MGGKHSKRSKGSDGAEAIKVPGTGGVQCDAVELRCGSDRAVVHLHGATLTSWTSDGDELIFMSDQAILDGKKAIRGGIPLVFPAFNAWEHGPNHGFARISTWTFEGSGTTEAGEVTATFTLLPNEATRAMWNKEFKLTYVVTLGPGKLTTTLTVANNGAEAFDFQALLHTYFRVPDIAKVEISGLEGVGFMDQLQGGKQSTEERKSITISENVDSIYKGAVAPVTIAGVGNSREATKRDHSGVKPKTDIVLHKATFPDTVVWNPWIEKSKAMADLQDDGYLHFVCVEAGAVSEKTSLAAGGVWTAGQTLVVQRHR